MKAYAIAQPDSANPPHAFFERLAQLSAAGVDVIQLRAGNLEGHDLLDLAQRCREQIGPSTVFLVNRRVDVAVAAGADGVHLPASGIPAAAVRAVKQDLIIGRSCHDLAAVREAAQEGVHYVLLGPVFAPRSKAGARGISLDDLRKACSIGVPVFALGGMSVERLGELRGIPLEGVAAITMYMDDDPVMATVEAVHAL